MRILICNWKDLRHPAAGGAEVYTHQVARRWALLGHDVTLFAAHVEGASPREVVDGVTVLREGSRLGVYRAARRHAESAPAYDLIFDEVNTRPFGAIRWAGSTPVVALIHQVCREIWFHEMSLPLAVAGRFVLEPWWLRAYRHAPVLTVSPSSRASLMAYGVNRVALVSEGIEQRPRPDVSRERVPTLIWVGRLTESKRPGDAVEALRLLREKVPDARLWIVGDGPLRHKLRGEGVELFGRVPREERDLLMARAHALMVTSVREGWGLVVDEAAAMGTPAAGYAVPGLLDSVPAAGGVLAEPSPAGMAETLALYLDRWMSAPASRGWRGGAKDWDEVAAEVLETACAMTGVRPLAGVR